MEDLLEELLAECRPYTQQGTLANYIPELAKGNIDADPYWHNADKNPCRWCDYRAACHFEEGCGDRRRFRRGLRAAQFWEWMDRWEEDGGGH